MRNTRMVVAAGLIAAVSSACNQPRAAEVGFWFEPVSYESRALGGRLSAEDIQAIATVARGELAIAFQGLTVTVTDRRAARYRVRVVQELVDQRMKRKTWVAGQAHPVSGFGGSGAVSFLFFASGALVYTPPGASRAELIEAIGRGIGRGAAHEFAHLLLPSAPIHDTRDVTSYEYDSAARPAQYFGEMRWDIAGPLLAARLSRK